MRKATELVKILEADGVNPINAWNEVSEYFNQNITEDTEITDEDFEAAMKDIEEARSAKC